MPGKADRLGLAREPSPSLSRAQRGGRPPVGRAVPEGVRHRGNAPARLSRKDSPKLQGTDFKARLFGDLPGDLRPDGGRAPRSRRGLRWFFSLDHVPKTAEDER